MTSTSTGSLWSQKKGIKEYLDISHVELVPSSQIAVVGNSFKSDIQPIIEIGGYGIHIPFTPCGGTR